MKSWIINYVIHSKKRFLKTNFKKVLIYPARNNFLRNEISALHLIENENIPVWK